MYDELHIFGRNNLTMLTKTEKYFLIVFCFILLFEIYTASYLPKLHYIAKPSILIALICFYWKQSLAITLRIRLLTLGALVFSLAGDILLMFVNLSAHFFTAGLAAFLLAHILYTYVFLKSRNTTKKPGLFVSVLLVYGISLFLLLQAYLGKMLLAVLLYMLVILIMATAAYLRYKTVSKISYYLVLIGAILFLISDSLLAINKFYTPLAYSNISIMFSYAFAQLFIVLGLLKQQ